MSELTPMMQQYMKTKEDYPDCVLFYRLGDFYEMFFDDAVKVSKELELTLTGKSCGLPGRLLEPPGGQRLQGGHLRADGRHGDSQGAGEAGCGQDRHAGN